MAYQITYGAATVPNFSFAAHDADHPTLMAFNAVLDLNGDGLDDVIMTSNYGGLSGLDPSPIKVLISNGTTLVDRTSANLPGVAGTTLVRDVFVADFNGDGKDDVFLNNTGTEGISPYPGEQNRLFLSNPSGTYDDVSTTNLPQLTDFSHGGGFGDFDGDGDLDIFVNQVGQDEVIYPYLMLNDGNGVFTIVDTLHNSTGDWFPAEVTDTNADIYFAHVFDMNGDGYADIWTSGIEFQSPHPHEFNFNGLVNDGNGHLLLSGDPGFFPALDDPATQVGEMAFHSDIDRDGDLDLIVKVSRYPFEGDDFLQLMINDGAGNFTDRAAARGILPSAFQNILITMPSIRVTDLDGDGDDDILVTGLDTSQVTETVVRVFLNKGDGTFQQVPQNAFPFLRPDIEVLDVNGDGIMDILTDITYNGPWNEDHTKQFYLYLGKLDVAVNRTGWGTDDRIFGGSKNDTLRGLAGDDRLQGNAGNDLVVGGSGDDTLLGSAGNDTLRGGPGRDALDGGPAVDTADYSDTTAAVSVALNGAAKVNVKVGGVNEDTLRRIENVTGGSKNDSLTGDGLANTLIGNAGADPLKGGAGNDVLKGGLGRDLLIGGSGSDTADYSDKNKPVSVVLKAAADAKVKVSGIVEDTIRGIENVIGGSKNDLLIGDQLVNRLVGNAGADVLKGGAGNDTIIGGPGNDVLSGGLGRDIMTGGPGADDFVFNSVAEMGKTAATRDRITDFTHGVDDIDLRPIDANGAASGHAFKFLAAKGAAFTGMKGELRWFQVDPAGSAGDKTIVEGDINGDRKADFQIELTGLKTLTEVDFFL
jgi:Ca2+-binding RTX toxin-like protein